MKNNIRVCRLNQNAFGVFIERKISCHHTEFLLLFLLLLNSIKVQIENNLLGFRLTYRSMVSNNKNKLNLVREKNT